MEKMIEVDQVETREWLSALDSVVDREGEDRARFLFQSLQSHSERRGLNIARSFNTPHVNTIATVDEPDYPGDLVIEKRLRAAIRWNSIAMVVRANASDKSIGGHLASYMSSCTLYEVGFNHFFKGPSEDSEGDLVYFQGHISPGIYARSFLEGRLSESQLDRFRREVGGGGLPSYPHPYLMPDYWQFSTVSMGLGPIQAIYQARLMKYLDNRGLKPLNDRRVWAFLGDGECDEVETLGALNLASRERLDNLIFVINCNLQRLDGPVRGNHRVMEELESSFLGSGWNVTKVVWGGTWDALLENDHDGLLKKLMSETVDGEYQNFKAQGGAYTRERFFGKYPALLERVAHLSDHDIENMVRGGHDPRKIYAAYQNAVKSANGNPTVILAHTVKGYGMGSEHGEADMEAHNIKTMEPAGLKRLRDRLGIPVTDEQLEKGMPYYRPGEDTPEMAYLHARRQLLGGYLPRRRIEYETLTIPGLGDKVFTSQLKGTGERKVSSTMAFVRILTGLTKHRELGERVVPIIPDEARTFGMEGMFRQLGIYAASGQKYEPVDAGQIMYYREDIKGQILEEGITEAGAMASWMAAATAHANHDKMLIPFYIYYAMFGFQRIGDLAWAAGDMLTRGFMVGGTAGRTTINGEGLQHQDGHSHLMASSIPNCRTYDPTYGYEIAVIIQHGLKEMYERHEECFYYLTIMNENYAHPAMPEGAEEGIVRGMYRLKKAENSSSPRVQLLGSGTILREAEAAAELLLDFGVSADVWSVTSFNELRREALEYDRQRFLKPKTQHEKPWIARMLDECGGPVIAATDYMKLYADQVRAWVPGDYYVLGTDGFGRSDSRAKLRAFFEVDRYYIAWMALHSLSEQGEIGLDLVEEAMQRFGIDADKLSPLIS
ncbi:MULTISPECIES: pyruvate dehydrogenase (acetyl-transferring), homodimeric type [unclassified Halomonas]|uniref:pyruvate dehydrogenase (acetyl-transferring), homodimeric type n=1 Tax=unclassified Halomonas TaxID=2609666 RepID=UPI0020A1898A|nr:MULTISPECIES: pyruvate dehydrogenase (acetyl-transferring), homodimeric type [unclassified Halomonas]MCP1314090.1 pyruvate dehydrogenase (acetyl-transferring), homodimeric type [Halomonas sp. 707D7]MCP1325701.1 pyruvate dehydrogenase (acetyl-transferring), homodimeric type [Halomonas sp. 707D4]